MLAVAMMCAAGTTGCSQSDFAGYTAIKTSDDDPDSTQLPDDGGAVAASSERDSVDATSVETEPIPSSVRLPDEQPTQLASGAESSTNDDAVRTTPETVTSDDAVVPAVVATSQATSTDPQSDTTEKSVASRPQNPEISPAVSPITADSAVTDAGSAVMTATPLPGGVRLLVPDQTFAVEGPEGALRVSFDDFDLLKILNMEPVPIDAEQHFPDWLKALDGRRIRMRGFMYPPYEETGIEMFLLARDNQICCFGRNPKIYDIIPVTLRQGHPTHYIQNRPFDVVGTFHIQPNHDAGELYQLYLIDDAVVID